MPVEVDEIQGNVAFAYGRPYEAARYVLLRIRHDRVAAARRVLADWLGAITFGRAPRDAPAHVNVAFTCAGLRALGVPDDELRAFPADFREGAWRRSRALDGPAARQDWERGYCAVHLLLSCHAHHRDGCDRRVGELLASVEREGEPFITCADQPAALLTRDARSEGATCAVDVSREHFGFADGCSQPAIDGIHRKREHIVGSGVYARLPPRPVLGRAALGQLREDLFPGAVRREWRPIRTGEFLLGYENESGVKPAGSEAPLGPNGTFMVYRKMEQHVERFRAHRDAEAARLGLEPATLEARIVGRWRQGTPLAVDDRGDPWEVASSRESANAFDYLDDPTGEHCPLGAHVRRTNPRSGLPGGGEVTMRHRIIRRGMPYGPELPALGPRGLIFISYGSSIADGFERIQQAWCDDGQALGLGATPDFLLQQRRDGRGLAPMDIGCDDAGLPVEVRAPDAPFVTVRGCAYLFVPGRRACERLRGLGTAG